MTRLIGAACVVGAVGVIAPIATAVGCFTQRTQSRAHEARTTYDVDTPPGYRVELVADKLTFPTGVAFGDRGDIYVVEAGYTSDERVTRPRIVLVGPGGTTRELATGDGAPWSGIAYHDGALFVAHGGVATGGRIVRYDVYGDTITGSHVLVDKLPSFGDHHTNGPVVSRDGWVYFAQGTATNSGVVGVDNFDVGWLRRNATFHDVPCEDITLSGFNFTSPNPLTEEDDVVTTGAFMPFNTPSQRGQLIKGTLPCTGAIMRVRARGGRLELVAWGFRNPFGLAFDPDDTLFVTENSYDRRGSRPIAGGADALWRVDRDTWYGWPDYSKGRPLTSRLNGELRGFLLARHPNEPPLPAGIFPAQASAEGLDFSRNAVFGYAGWAFVAGRSLVRMDPRTGDVVEFARTRRSKAETRRGFERPVAARFDRTGTALYVVDFGVVRMTEHGPSPEPETGRLWRIVKDGE
jgi:glucose/arabinose dehydrogenase